MLTLYGCILHTRVNITIADHPDLARTYMKLYSPTAGLCLLGFLDIEPSRLY